MVSLDGSGGFEFKSVIFFSHLDDFKLSNKVKIIIINDIILYVYFSVSTLNSPMKIF